MTSFIFQTWRRIELSTWAQGLSEDSSCIIENDFCTSRRVDGIMAFTARSDAYVGTITTCRRTNVCKEVGGNRRNMYSAIRSPFLRLDLAWLVQRIGAFGESWFPGDVTVSMRWEDRQKKTFLRFIPHRAIVNMFISSSLRRLIGVSIHGLSEFCASAMETIHDFYMLAFDSSKLELISLLHF